MPINALESTGFRAPSGTNIDGFVAVGGSLNKLSTHEASVVRQAAAFDVVDFVFFRRFDDTRSSKVCAYIVDNDKHNLSNDELAKLHGALWLHGVAPLVYITSMTRIDILSCARGPDFWNASSEEKVFNPAVKIELAASIEKELKKLQRFQANRLGDGTFWHDEQNKRLSNHKNSAHETLIQAIVDVDQKLEGAKNPILRQLLLLMVLIKYLEDRKVFPKRGWFGHYCKGATSFLDVLRKGTPANVIAVLKKLQQKFNGDVFSLSDNTESLLTEEALRLFSEMVDTSTIKRQKYLWEQYSFEYIPVEIISHLYNRFLTGKNQVYTPPFLAELILDYAMPYKKLKGTERVLDPACGSGVFLVGAFRRLVNVWKKKNKWKDPDVDSLKQILNDCIFGVEHHPTAVDLTAFSLSLALCDALKPNVIWSDLQFDQLRAKNVFESDFFDCIPVNQKSKGPPIDLGKFDVIVGNPPFESELTESAESLNLRLEHERGILPDAQIAYLFLEQAIGLLKTKGMVCLIQPQGFLYNQKTLSFRNRLLSEFRFDTILDFVSIGSLFDGAQPKTVATLICNERPNAGSDVTHQTFRRTFQTHQRIGFELDHYDLHKVPSKVFFEEPVVWKLNLLGGGRLLQILQRLSEAPTLKQFVDDRGWIFREGFNAGTVVDKNTKQSFLAGKPHVPNEGVVSDHVETDKIVSLTITHFERSREQELYEPPLILLRKLLELPIAFWEESFLSFTKEIVGISADPKDRKELRSLFEKLCRSKRLLRFSALLRSTRGLLKRATAISKRDIELLPVPVSDKDLRLSYWEDVIESDTTNFMVEYVRLGQNSRLLKETADKERVMSYAKLYKRMLGSVYDNLKIGKPTFFGGLICQPFYFGSEPESEWLVESNESESNLHELVHGQYGSVVRTNRIVRFYDENVIFVVKPNRLRYWIRSTAIRDVDDTLVDLQEQGY